jgi:hypothetical protein
VVSLRELTVDDKKNENPKFPNEREKNNKKKE